MRRGILASVSSVYDPLGLVAPFLLTGKQILQDLCKNQTDWDEPIPDVFRTRWEKWRSELHTLAQLLRCQHRWVRTVLLCQNGERSTESALFPGNGQITSHAIEARHCAKA